MRRLDLNCCCSRCCESSRHVGMPKPTSEGNECGTGNNVLSIRYRSAFSNEADFCGMGRLRFSPCLDAVLCGVEVDDASWRRGQPGRRLHRV